MYYFFKNLIKKILSKTSWRFKKLYKNKNYVHQKPNIDVIKTLYNSTGVLHMGAHRGGEAQNMIGFKKKQFG